MSILDFLKRKKEKEEAKERKYPTLEEYVGNDNEPIAIFYISYGRPKAEEAFIQERSNDERFYIRHLNQDKSSKFIIFWNEMNYNLTKKEDGLLSAVKKIVDKDGKVIYENKELKFDYANAQVEPHRLVDRFPELKEAKEKKLEH